MAIHIRRSETHITMRDDQASRKFRIKTDMDGVAELIVDERTHCHFQIDVPVTKLTWLDMQIMLQDVQDLMNAKDWPVCGVINSSDLGNDWTAEHHLKVYQDLVPRGCTQITGAPCKTAT